MELFGGATNNTPTDWLKASRISKLGIHNYYSKNDKVLKYLYQAFEVGNSPIGLNPIAVNGSNIKNYDISNTIKSHFEYKENLSKILK